MGQNNNIHNIIMRRLYYTYALRAVLHRRTLHGLLIVGSVYLLGVFVHVRAVFENLAAVKVGEVDTFLYSMLTHTEAWTLLTFLTALFLTASFMRNLVWSRPRTLHFA